MDKQFVLRAKSKDGHLDANDHCLLCCGGIGCTHGHADGTVHSAGFSFRFVYQWYYSYRRHASLLPLGFWIISLIGSGTIVIYGIIRRDPVLILGQSFGFVAYARNIVLLSRQRKTDGQ
ncbi:lipid-A-disaccharide synthase N-terminal domain-containing protein [Hoylesella buccalis]|uniref:lipid-A-disaccharide synthase N-terminal domain-containing protein n=1 Tax=Hoylesella buccalis TaxID=28127 RepID=UPI003C6BD8C7